MADNFLERRMDDYRSGRLSSSGAGRAKTISRPTAIVHVHGEEMASRVGALRKHGAAVSFSGMDGKTGMLLAQETGSMFCPFELAEALERVVIARQRIDAVVVAGLSCVKPLVDNLIAIADRGVDGAHRIDPSLGADDQARLVIALSKISTRLEIVARNDVE